jgi:hypothetical protein
MSSRQENILGFLDCPITQSAATHPVITADGQTYEEEALRQWFRRCQQQAGRGKARFTSPTTNCELKPVRKMDKEKAVDDLATLYIPNFAVKKIVAALDGSPPPLKTAKGSRKPSVYEH